MRVIYYTSGVSGSGRVVRGLSIGNAIRRAGKSAEFTILSSCPFAYLADQLGFAHLEIPTETEDQLGPSNYHNSQLCQALDNLNPDILLIDLLWFPLYNFVQQIPCKTIFLWQQMRPRFFSMELPDRTISFQPEHYDLVVGIEPCRGPRPEVEVNPLILRDREAIFSRSKAAKLLDLDESSNNCLMFLNAHPGDFEKTRDRFAYLANSGYRMVYSTNYQGGIFPVVDYFNAFDLIVCGASYNSFWEAIYFDKEAIFIPIRTQFVDTDRLVREYRNYRFQENGADQLVRIIFDL